MKIEVGEYVRTKNGEIAIFRGYNKKKASQWIYKLEFQKRKFPKYCAEGYITNHSKEIIGLIEVGDYVNGNKTHSVDYSTSIQTGEKYLVIDKIYQSVKYFYEKDIRSIVTKEQFNNMEYKINE